VICPSSLVEPLAVALEQAGIEFGIAPRSGLDLQVTVVPVGLVKGLEVDASVVVEPAGIVAEEAQGYRALYVPSPGRPSDSPSFMRTRCPRCC
jgi:hypothetical protein